MNNPLLEKYGKDLHCWRRIALEKNSDNSISANSIWGVCYKNIYLGDLNNCESSEDLEKLLSNYFKQN